MFSLLFRGLIAVVQFAEQEAEGITFCSSEPSSSRFRMSRFAMATSIKCNRYTNAVQIF